MKLIYKKPLLFWMFMAQFFINFNQAISVDYILILKKNKRQKTLIKLKAKMWRRGYDGLGNKL